MDNAVVVKIEQMLVERIGDLTDRIYEPGLPSHLKTLFKNERGEAKGILAAVRRIILQSEGQNRDPSA